MVSYWSVSFDIKTKQEEEIMKIMKKLLALGLCVSMMTAMVACGGSDSASTESTSAAGEKTTIGFIYVGASDDYGYNQAAYKGMEAVKAHFGDKVEILNQEKVPETSEASDVLEQMIQSGATILFPTSFGHLTPAEDVAKNYPNVIFEHQGGMETMPNLGTYFGTIWDPYYLAGIAAGHATKSNKLGFVAAFPISQSLANVNAYTLGAQSVNPDITTTVIFTGDWSDPAKQTEAANTLIADGCDVLAQHQDATKTIVELCEANNVYTVGYHADASELAPNMWLTAAVWDWSGLFVDICQAIMDGKWQGSQYDAIYRGGMAEGIVDLAPFGKAVPQEVQDEILALKAEMIAGTRHTFENEIKDQNGNVVCENGSFLSEEQVESMNYFVEGVIGTIE